MALGRVAEGKNYKTPAHLMFMRMYWLNIKDDIKVAFDKYSDDAEVDVGKKKTYFRFQYDECRRLYDEQPEEVKTMVENFRMEGKSVPRKREGETNQEYKKR